jgi:hypothetical protein
MTLEADQRHFYRECVAAQFNRTLARQREIAETAPAEARVLEEMEAVRASIEVRVDLGGRIERHAFDIERGEMELVTEAKRPPFLVLGHDLRSYPNLRKACGDSLLGFLGALAGLGDEMRLTSLRVRSLRELAGGLVLELPGEEGFALSAHFGEGATVGVGEPAPRPRATIRIDAETFARLRSGALDPQEAFLDGRIEVEGDEGMAIGLALAAASPI